MTRKQKIALISHSPLMSGGAELSLLEIAKFLNQSYEIIIVLPGEGDFADALKKLGINYTIHTYLWSVAIGRLPVGNPKDLEVWNADAIIGAYNFLQNNKVDIVISNTIVVPWYAQAAKALNIPNAMIVSEMHDQRNGLELLPNNQEYLDSLAYIVDYFFYNSDFTAGTYDGLFPKQNSMTLYPVITVDKPDNFRPDVKVCVDFDKSKLRLIVPGTIIDHKNQLELLAATKLLVETMKIDVSVTLMGGVGAQRYVNKVKRYIRDNQLQAVVKLSPFSHDLLASLEDFDIAVIPSVCEAFGRVTVESMLAGRLVIGSNTGGTTELLENGKAGLLYKGGNPQALADTIAWVFKHKVEAQKLAALGQRRAYKNFIATNSNQDLLRILTTNPIFTRKPLPGDNRYNFIRILIERNNYVNAKLIDYATSVNERNQVVAALERENKALTRNLAVKTVHRIRRTLRRVK